MHEIERLRALLQRTDLSPEARAELQAMLDAALARLGASPPAPQVHVHTSPPPAAPPSPPSPPPPPAVPTPPGGDPRFDQLMTQMNNLTSSLSTRFAAQDRAELQAYINFAINQAGGDKALVVAMVGGNTREEVDASIVRAKAEFDRLKTMFQPPPAAPPAGTQPPAAPPGYGPTGAPPPAGASGGFPTAPNAAPVYDQTQNPGAAADPINATFGQMTTEEAVRSGTYGKNRAAIHAALRGTTTMGQVNLGVAPRYLSHPSPVVAQNHVSLPGGVQHPATQPQYQPPPGYQLVPTQPPPAAPPQPQYQPPPGYQLVPVGQTPPPPAAPQSPPPGGGPVPDINAANAAIQRTHAGLNPVAGQNPGGNTVVTQAQRMVAAGADPQQIYQNRFANTPPVQLRVFNQEKNDMSSVLNTAVQTGGGFQQQAQAIRDVFSAEIWFGAQPVMKFDQFSTKKTELGTQTGRTIVMPKYGNLKRGGRLTEGTRIRTRGMSMSNAQITVYENGNALAFTEYLLQTAFYDQLSAASLLLGRDMALVLDTQLRDTVMLGTNTVFGGQKTARTSLTANDKFNTQAIKDAVELLETFNAPKWGGDHYIAFIHPHQARGLKDDVDWQNASLYAGATQIYTGEIGRYEDVRFVSTTVMPNGYNNAIDADTGDYVDVGFNNNLRSGVSGNVVNVYQAVIFGEYSIGHATALPVELRDSGVEDFGREHGLAWYSIWGSAILENQNIVVIETA